MFSTHGTRCMTDFMSNDKRYDYTLYIRVPRDCSSLLQRQRFIFHPEPGDVQGEMVNKTID